MVATQPTAYGVTMLVASATASPLLEALARFRAAAQAICDAALSRPGLRAGYDLTDTDLGESFALLATNSAGQVIITAFGNTEDALLRDLARQLWVAYPLAA